MNMFKKNGGFTLVELIVVIAILAILAGVAVPAYTGYINRANEAADTQVVAAINTAVAAALAENRLAPSDASTYLTAAIADGVLTIGANDAGDAEADALAAEILKDFKVYFNGVATAEMKYYTTANGFNTNGTLNVQ